MRKKFLATYLIIFVTLLAIMSLSRASSEKMRGESVAWAAPFWQKVLSVKHFILHPFQSSPFVALSMEEEKQKLQLENQLLKNENSHLQRQLKQRLLLDSQISDRQEENRIDVIEKSLRALPARVIFRSFDSWHQEVWINVGETLNREDETPLIGINSPVVIGNAIVGIIDYVGKNQSRVMLITDSRLNPSVRAARGGEQDFYASEQIEKLLQHMYDKKPVSTLSPDELNSLEKLLTKLNDGLQPFKKTWYLAKGELLGSPSSYKIGQKMTLAGTGFNYDFSDEEGEARDLRSGKPLQNHKDPAIPILKINDLLITTGMDGVFPPGFHVAIVTHIGLLKEGDFFYELEARPVAGPLEELSLVFVLPPLKRD